MSIDCKGVAEIGNAEVGPEEVEWRKYWDDISGQELDAALTKDARAEEISEIHRMGVYEKVSTLPCPALRRLAQSRAVRCLACRLALPCCSRAHSVLVAHSLIKIEERSSGSADRPLSGSLTQRGLTLSRRSLY